jgi:CspA family cold shock protein
MFNVKNILILIVASLVAGFIAKMAGPEFAPFIAAFLSTLLLLTIMSFLPVTSTRPATKSNAMVNKNNHSKDPIREEGVVKWFDSNKGYGFITRAMGEDIFVHFRSIRGKGHRSLYEGQNVEFSVTNSDKGPQAEDITVLK